MAGEVDKTPAQVALRWLLQQPGVTAPITGARTLAHLEDNIGATGWALSEAHLNRLTTASQMAWPYPYDMVSRVQAQR